MNSFDGMRGNNDGVVTKQEWTDYYTDLAVSTPSDDYFVVMMEQSWGMAEDEADAPFKDQVRQYVALLRQRLVTVSNGSQEEYKLRQIFNEFDANQSGMLTVDEIAALMAKL